MAFKISKRVLQWIHVAGCAIIKFPLGVAWYYGNLAAYMYSYFIYRLGPNAFNSNTGDWLLTTYIISAAIGTITVDLLSKCIRMRYIQLGSILAVDIGLLLTYFSVQYSVELVLVTLLMVCGFGLGVANIVALKYVAKTIPEKVGFYSAIVSGGLMFGAMIHGYVITAYLNPDNYSPDYHWANMLYFSQIKLLDRVPDVFLVLGLMAVVFHVTGFLLQQIPLPMIKKYGNAMDETISISAEREERLQQNGKPLPNYTSGIEPTKPRPSDFEDHSISLPRNSEQNGCQSQGHSMSSPTDNEIQNVCQQQSVSNQQEQTDWNMSPLEVLRTKTFYVLWFAMCIITYGQLLTLNFYKLYGELWIHDDIFLTSASSLSAISACVCRVLFGSLVDVIGVKNTLITVYVVNGLCSLLWYFAPRVDKWLYFICLQCVIGVQGTNYVVFPLSALKLYGAKFYASNYGMILTANVVISVASPFLYASLQASFGMFGMVLLGSVCSIVVIIAVILFIPSTIDKH